MCIRDSNNATIAENKVLILYVLNKANKPLSSEALLKLIMSLTEMNYFYFQQFLLDLIATKYIISYEKEQEEVYEITDSGKQALSLTEDLVPGILKLKVDKDFKDTLDTIEDELSVTAEYTPRNEKDYVVKCKIVENNTTIFEVQTFAGSREQAKDIVENWKERATDLYPKIIELLTKK